MAEDSGVETSQEGASTQPQAGTSSSGQAPGAAVTPATATAASGTEDVATLRSQLDELRRESAASRKETKRLQEAAQAAEDAKLTETERITKENAELKRANEELLARDKETRLSTAIVAAATRLGFRSPEIASKLLDRSTIDLAEDGHPRNLDRLLGEILKAEPYLARSAPDLGGGTRGGQPQGTDMDAWIRQAARGERQT